MAKLANVVGSSDMIFENGVANLKAWQKIDSYSSIISHFFGFRKLPALTQEAPQNGDARSVAGASNYIKEKTENMQYQVLIIN
jgi:hypothetical protein